MTTWEQVLVEKTGEKLIRNIPQGLMQKYTTCKGKGQPTKKREMERPRGVPTSLMEEE